MFQENITGIALCVQKSVTHDVTPFYQSKLYSRFFVFSAHSLHGYAPVIAELAHINAIYNR